MAIHQRYSHTRAHKQTLSTAFKLPALLSASIMFLTILPLTQSINSRITDNTCTFKLDDKMFSFMYLNRYATGQYYSIAINPNSKVIFNFCEPILPLECQNSSQNADKAFSFLVSQAANDPLVTCTPFSSDSKTHYFETGYTNNNGIIRVNLNLSTKPDNQSNFQTDFIVDCQQSDDPSFKNIQIWSSTANKLVIYGQTPYGCPIFQLSSIWAALTDNSLLFGFVLVILGFVMLFFGILMTHLMIFLTAYFLSFAVLIGIFTAFLAPNSNQVAIYFSLLVILFLSTLIAYGLTRLVNLSIFFIGAFFGFIVAAIVNSIFCKIFSVYSVWSLVFFEVVLTIPFGLLTFKYSELVIVMSTSLVGSYMVVRPISWIFGGYPNEFTLYQMVDDGQLNTLPWTFFIYLVFIIAIAILGALYQFLKIKRRSTGVQIEKNFITENVEEHIDRIHEAVKNIMNKYAPNQLEDDKQNQYKKMNELVPFEGQLLDGVETPRKSKERKSKEEVF